MTVVNGFSILTYVINKQEVTNMKPATSALNDWVQRIVVSPRFMYCPVCKTDEHFATIKLGCVYYYDFDDEHYSKDCAIEIILKVIQDKNGKFYHETWVQINTPTCFLKNQLSTSRYSKNYRNLTLKNIFDFNEMFWKMYTKTGCDSLNYIYNLPNYNKIRFGGNVVKKNFESYLMEKQREYDLFQTFRDSLFSYLDKCSQINAKKKDINNDFVKG